MGVWDWLRKRLNPDAAVRETMRAQMNEAAASDHVPSPEFVAYSERMLAFMTAPDRKTRRARAMRSIRAAIAAEAGAAGLRAEGREWIYEGRVHRARLMVTPSRHGAIAFVDMRLDRLDGRPTGGPLFDHDDTVRLALFCRNDENTSGSPENAVFDYGLIEADPESLAPQMTLLRERALPWLMASADAPAPRPLPPLPPRAD